jgi:hypothetical protein
MKNKLSVFALSFFLISCGLNTNNQIDLLNNSISSNNINSFSKEINKKQKAKWTVMVYISGDNDLEEYVVKDIENELALIGSTENVQVTAIADRINGYDKSRGDWKTTKLFHIKKGLKATSENAVQDLGEKNTGDPKTLIDFVNWSKTNYPADKYALFMWGHGWNWRPGYTMEDKTSKDALDPHEVKSSLNSLGQIDMIAYDGCNMASIEVDALWANHAKAIVHSQEYVDWDGIEYDTVIKKLNDEPDMNADKLAIITNQSASVNKEKTGSAIALDNRWNNMLKAVDIWSIALKNGLNKYRKSYDVAFKASQIFIDAPDDKDLYDMAFQINKNVNDDSIKQKSQDLMKAIKNVVLDEWHIAKEYPNAHGITISKIKFNDEYRDYYKKSEFAKNTNWDEFLDLYKM